MRILHTLLATVLIISSYNGFTQNIETPYQVATWPEFRNSAISYTFDDGCSNQFAKAIPIFDEFDYKLTLFTVTDWSSGNWQKLKSAASKGHEVANHSKTHANFSQITPEKQDEEVRVSNELINNNITSQKSVTMAYPYCATGKDTIFMKYFIAVRGCQGFTEPKTPGSFMNISSVICGDQGSVKTTKDFNTKADQASNSKGWLVYLLHGVDNDGGYSPVSSDTLKASLEYLQQNDSKFWVNTFGNVARYVKERNGAILKETSSDSKSLTIEITDDLDNEIFNFPLTIRRPLPDGWSDASVKQNGVEVKDSIVEINSVKHIQFEAIPDGGRIQITKVSGTGILKKKINTKGNNQFKTWVDDSNLHFTTPSDCLKNVRLTIFNSQGLKIKTTEEIKINGNTNSINLNTLPESGFYLIQLDDTKNKWESKIRF